MKDDDIAHDVLRALRQIMRRVSEHSRALSQQAGLTVPQLLCVKAIGELADGETEVTVAAVAAQVHLSAPTVSRIIDRLVRTGLVERARGSRDRRRVNLSLTESGQARFKALPAPLQDRFVRRLSSLPLSERYGILSALYRISELMDATELDAAPILAPEDALRKSMPDETN